MKKQIALIGGDGVGPDCVLQGKRVLEKIALKFGHNFSFVDVIAGGSSIDKFGVPLTDENLEKCLYSDAVLLGAVGAPKWDSLPSNIRPEKALLKLRSAMKVFANLRPAKMFHQLSNCCPLKKEIVKDGLDVLIVRELTGGIYFGKSGRFTSDEGCESAFDTECYSENEINRILKIGFDFARARQKKLCLVDKANILESSRLWRESALLLSHDYPDVALSFMYVDNASMQLVKNPSQFDVIVTSNMFGDILSDEASQITGSIGMLPSASFGDREPSLYEPVHGSAFELTGKNVANPLATILSCSMMLRYGFKLENEAVAVEKAVNAALDDGYRTKDIASFSFNDDVTLQKKEKIVGTTEMCDAVLAKI